MRPRSCIVDGTPQNTNPKQPADAHVRGGTQARCRHKSKLLSIVATMNLMLLDNLQVRAKVSVRSHGTTDEKGASSYARDSWGRTKCRTTQHYTASEHSVTKRPKLREPDHRWHTKTSALESYRHLRAIAVIIGRW